MIASAAKMRERIAAKIRWRTPPEIAAELRVKAATVRAWIVSGELRAINVASAGCRRPRFRIDPADLAIFLNRRAAAPTPKTQRRRRDEGVIEYF